MADIHQAIADVEASLADVVNTVRCIDEDKNWRNNLCVRLEQLRFYVRELRAAEKNASGVASDSKASADAVTRNGGA